MFERYTEEARYCIFWARAAALMEESDSITPIHLLAGIQKERPGVFRQLKLDKAKMNLPVLSEKALRKVHQQERPREIQLDETAKRALKVAAETAEKLGGEKVSPLHMLEAVLRSDATLRKRLEKAGVTGSHVKLALEKHRAADFKRAPSMRSGMGYDLHRLAEKRKLIIGGIEIPFEKGAVAHSDGDVLIHAICDALLGAAGLGDIGTHFPDSEVAGHLESRFSPAGAAGPRAAPLQDSPYRCRCDYRTSEARPSFRGHARRFGKSPAHQPVANQPQSENKRGRRRRWPRRSHCRAGDRHPRGLNIPSFHIR
jgi:hypothetical protein